MKKIIISIIFLLAVASVIWFAASSIENSQVGNNTEPPNPPAYPKPEAVVQNNDDLAREQPIEEDGEMTAFEERIGRKFTIEEKRLKPPEMGWTAWGQFVDMHRQDSFSNGKVAFYGLVVTPDGEPIPGVQLTAEISKYIESIAEKLVKGDSTKLKKISLITDEEGRFSVSGEEGNSLEIFNFSKDGFEFVGEKKYWGGSFNPHVPNFHQPDPDDPVVFTMKKVE